MAKLGGLLSQVAAVLALAALSSPVSAQEGRIQLDLRLEPGEKYYLWSSTHDEITYPSEGAPWVSNDQLVQEVSLDVLSVDPTGTARVDLRYERVSLRFEDPNRLVEFDSRRPPGVIHEDAAPYAALVGLGYRVRISAQGTAFDFQGVDEMLDALIDHMQLPEGDKAARRPEFEQDFGERAQREWLQIALGYLPTGAISQGAEWDTAQQLMVEGVIEYAQPDYKVFAQ